MTVTYSLQVSNARLNGFAKLLIRWRGSIYKLLYREMLIFCGLYYGLLVLYRLVLNESQRSIFEKLAIYCNAFTELIPLSFVLGFYVTIVVGRWWNQFLAIPWPDKVCMLISAYVHGNDERGRMIRRTLARYLSLLNALTFQGISTAVKKRFPTLDHLVEAGLMTKEEHQVYDEVKMEHGKWWVPAQWFTSLAVRARKEGRIKDDILLKSLLDEMHVFRGNCGLLFAFDWISIPLVYTQVVTLAIYTYFIATVMGRQYLDPSKGYPGHEHDINLYVPVFTILQFFFYMGWLKVAEQLINPFGEDDDDFELNWCLDRNLVFSYNVVDELHADHPRLVKDLFWDDPEPQLPYTRSSFSLRTQPHLGSAVNLDINLDEAEFVTMETIMEEDRDENNYNSPPRSPSYDFHGPPSFCVSPDGQPRKVSAYTVDGETTSLSKVSFLGSRLLNMIIGSNKDLSQSSDTVSCKEGTHNVLSSPFVLKTPCGRKKASSCSEPFINHFIDDKRFPDDPAQCLLPSKVTDSTTTEEQESLILNDSHNYQEKPADHCTIKIPDLSVVEEESSSSASSIRSSSSSEALDENKQQNDVVLEMEQEDYSHKHDSSPSPPPPYDSSSSQESLLTTSSDSSQSTVNSYSELLKHEM